MAIRSLSGYLAVAEQRLEAFYQVGCRFTDHSLDSGFTYLPADKKMISGLLLCSGGRA